METVFLSASVPDPRRDPRYYDTADVVAIREAVRALASVVLPRARLVFGGHPAVTPMVRQVAEALGRVDRVRIYQSRYFAPEAPADNAAFPWLVWVDADGDQAGSLLRMREAMLSRHRLKAAVFVGGMDGVVDEHAMVCRLQPGAVRLPVGSTGAAALVLLAAPGTGLAPETARMLERDTVYGALFERLLWPPRRRA